MNVKKFFSLSLALLIATLPVIAIAKRQAIFDWWRLKDYSPSSRIVELANNTTMTDDGRHLLYVYHADLQNSEEFNYNCDFNEQSIVLGCYVSGQGIYIFDVTDERLKGIHEVTAAHEVLHAAYERLSKNEQEKIDMLTQAAFDNLQSQRIKDTVEAYRKKDPSIVPNELHSILGTEVRDLPAELESYYAKYFQDRKTIVSYSERYEQAFSERKARADQISAQIESLKQQIKEYEERLSRTKSELEAEFASLESQRSSAEPNSFNTRVRAYNAKVRSYNAMVQQSYTLIDEHNSLVAEYNKVVLEEKELIEAIDSRPETIQQQ
jgi:hypothetical protein